MELKQTIEMRASVRKYKMDAVPVDDLREMVRRAGMSPSVNNSQPWKFIAITNRELLNRMAEAVENQLDTLLPQADSHAQSSIKATVEYFSTFFKDAPAVIAVTMHPYEAIIDKLMIADKNGHSDINQRRNNPDIQSVGAAVQTILLSAVDLGYGACWLSSMLIAQEQLQKLLNVEAPWKLMAFIAVGKPAAEPRQRDKKDVTQIFEHLA